MTAPEEHEDLVVEVVPPMSSRRRSVVLVVVVFASLGALWFGIVSPLLSGEGLRGSQLFIWWVFYLPFVVSMVRIVVVGKVVRLTDAGVTYSREILWPRRLPWAEVETVGLDHEHPWTTGVIATTTDGRQHVLVPVEADQATSPRIQELIDTANRHIARHRPDGSG